MGPAEPQLSSDGRWWWDGYQWLAVQQWPEQYQRWPDPRDWARYQRLQAGTWGYEERRRTKWPWVAIAGMILLAGLTVWSSGAAHF